MDLLTEKRRKTFLWCLKALAKMAPLHALVIHNPCFVCQYEELAGDVELECTYVSLGIVNIYIVEGLD